jgi:hypothetical protein
MKRFFGVALLFLLLTGISFAQGAEKRITVNLAGLGPGGNCCAGDKITVNWTATSNCWYHLKILLMRESGTLASMLAHDANRDWRTMERTIPASLRTSPGRYFVRVQTTDDEVYGDSRLFALHDCAAGRITVEEPSAGDVFEIGKRAYIRWEKHGVYMDPYVYIALYKGTQFKQGITLKTPNSCKYSWNVFVGHSDLVNAANCRIKISTKDQRVSGMSPVFTIKAPSQPNLQGSLTVNSLNSGKPCCAGSTYVIKWSKDGNFGMPVEIMLFRNITAKQKGSPLFSGLPPDRGSVSWKIPSSFAQSPGDYFIRVKTVGYNVAGRSPPFSIANCAAGTIRVTSPTPGQAFSKGDTIPVRWQKSEHYMDSRVYLGLFKDGKFLRAMTLATSNSGSYQWKIPVSGPPPEISPSHNYQIEVGTKDHRVKGMSGRFSIGKKILRHKTRKLPPVIKK